MLNQIRQIGKNSVLSLVLGFVVVGFSGVSFANETAPAAPAAVEKSAPAAAVAQQVLTVTGMTCASCASAVEKKLKSLPGVSAVKIDVKSGTVKLTVPADKKLTEKEIREAIDSIGFKVKKVTDAKA